MSLYRKDFPYFAQPEALAAFLDSAASAQKLGCVLERMEQLARVRYANIHRGVHSLAEGATAAYESARETLANFIGASSAASFVFTSGTTHSLNIVAHGLGRGVLPKGATILVSAYEHHSNYLPWQRLASDIGGQLKVLHLNPRGEIELPALELELRSGAALVAISHVSNVLGVVSPIAEVAALARRYGAIVVVDGAQAVSHLPVDVAALDVDFYAFSGHKLYGPTGVGGLYIAPPWQERLPPMMLGGGMVHRVGLTESSWAPAPYRFEAGTPPILEAVGLAAAADYLTQVGWPQIQAHEAQLMGYLQERLERVKRIKIYGSPAHRVGAISFNIGSAHPHDVGSVLAARGVAVRVGHHCAQPLMAHLGIPACVRASLGIYNTPQEIDYLISALEEAATRLC
jgi:cysteine desulfurase / selenocysteine lyase